MLMALNSINQNYFKTLIPVLHRYFLASCWKIQHLIPQKHLRNGHKGAEKWIDGEIDDAELYRLNWYAEAECFAFDYIDDTEELQEIQTLVNGIDELQDVSFEEGKEILKKAAYFVDSSMVYPKINHAPFVKSLCTSQFLCPDLLREYIKPDFSALFLY